VLTLFPGSENNSISNIKLIIPMHTALIFKEQAKVKALRKKGLAQPHYSIQHIEGYDLLCYKDNKQDLHSSIIEINNKEYCPGTMNIYFIWDRLEQKQKRLSGIPWHGLVLHKMLNIDSLCSTCQVCQMTKKERKKYGLLPPKIAESDPWVMVCVDLVGPFTIRKPAKTHSLLALTMIDPAINTGCFEIVKATHKSATSIQDLFHNIWLARYLRPQFIVFDNGGKFKREFKQMCDNYDIKAKPTTNHNPQTNAIIEWVHKVVNDMLRSFDLENENNHENLEEQEDNPFD
jgi:hypothetical protein